MLYWYDFYSSSISTITSLISNATKIFLKSQESIEFEKRFSDNEGFISCVKLTELLVNYIDRLIIIIEYTLCSSEGIYYIGKYAG